MSELKLKIVTPEGVIYTESILSVTIPGKAGELGVLPGHIPLATQIIAGELVVQLKDKTSYLAVGDGFAEITPTLVTVLTDMFIDQKDIDTATVEEAKRKAEERLKQKLSAEEMALTQAALAKSVVLLSVKRKHR